MNQKEKLFFRCIHLPVSGAINKPKFDGYILPRRRHTKNWTDFGLITTPIGEGIEKMLGLQNAFSYSMWWSV